MTVRALRGKLKLSQDTQAQQKQRIQKLEQQLLSLQAQHLKPPQTLQFPFVEPQTGYHQMTTNMNTNLNMNNMPKIGNVGIMNNMNNMSNTTNTTNSTNTSYLSNTANTGNGQYEQYE